MLTFVYGIRLIGTIDVVEIFKVGNRPKWTFGIKNKLKT